MIVICCPPLKLNLINEHRKKESFLWLNIRQNLFEALKVIILDEKRTYLTMADSGVQIKKKRTFKKYTYRGVDLDQLLAIKWVFLLWLTRYHSGFFSNFYF